MFIFAGRVCRRFRDGSDSSHGGSYVLGGLALLPVRSALLRTHLPPHRYVTQNVHFNCYRPQRSWGKVVFSQACVILFTGASASVHTGIPPPNPATPQSTPPQDHTPLEQIPPREQTPPLGPGTPLDQAPPGADSPLPQSMVGYTVNARAVPILLECNLVIISILARHG